MENPMEKIEKKVDDILIDMCVKPDCPDPEEHAQYKPIIKRRLLELIDLALSAQRERLVEKVEGMKNIIHKRIGITGERVVRNQAIDDVLNLLKP